MPQIRCPNCGMTINLENRREIDLGMILKALEKKPRSFTELLHITHLPRKTLDLRLKYLIKSGAIVKDEGYRLNGTLPFNIRGDKMKKNLLHLRKNILLAFLILGIGLPVVTYAVLYTPPRQPPPEPCPTPPKAWCTVSPSPPYHIRWTEQWVSERKERVYTYPNLTFDAATSHDPDGQVVGYIWNLGDGTINTGLVTTHTYTAAGTYTATLTVIDNDNLTVTVQKTITILSTETTVYMEPQTTEGLVIGETFTVNIVVSDVVDLWGWQAGLTFDPEVLECLSFEKSSMNASKELIFNGSAYTIDEGLFPGTEGENFWIIPKIDNTAGTTGTAGCGLWESYGVSGSGTLATITFRVRDCGSSGLHFTNVLFVSPGGKEISVNTSDGYFESA